MIDQGISPTTGRKLADLPPVDNFSGIVMTGKYQPDHGADLQRRQRLRR